MASELKNRFSNYFNSDDLFGELGRSLFNRNYAAPVHHLKTDMMESDTQYQVAIDMPGISRNDITIDFDNGLLSVSAKRDSFSDTSDHDGNMIASERSYGRFTRQYHFLNVDQDHINATYKDGVLKITLPKVSAANSKQKHIQVN